VTETRTNPLPCSSAAPTPTQKQLVATLVRDAGFEPVDLGGPSEMILMEAPRREGAVFGEAYRPEDARTVAAAATHDLTKAARLAITLKLPDA
jgi:hypothetical protein